MKDYHNDMFSVLEIAFRFAGGLCFGFLCAKLVNRFGHRLGVFADVVGVSAAMAATGLWIWATGKVF